VSPSCDSSDGKESVHDPKDVRVVVVVTGVRRGPCVANMGDYEDYCHFRLCYHEGVAARPFDFGEHDGYKVWLNAGVCWGEFSSFSASTLSLFATQVDLSCAA